MLNECRGSDPIKVRSRRWTLLCWITFCLLIFLLIIVFPFNFIQKRRTFLSINETKSINVLKYRSSLIQCGQSVVEEENSLDVIEYLMKQFEKNDFLSFNKQMKIDEKKFELIQWFQSFLNQCFVSKEFSINEQEKPTILRRLVSFLRKEIFYFIGFFTNQN